MSNGRKTIQIKDILASMGIGDTDAQSDEPKDARQMVEDVLESMKVVFSRDDEGNYHASGARFGCRFADVRVIVDENGRSCLVKVDTHVDVPVTRRVQVRKYMTRFNTMLLMRGIVLDEQGRIRFETAKPVMLTGDDALELAIGRALSSVSEFVSDAITIICGIESWELDSLRNMD